MNDVNKLAIVGLAKAGKTSILRRCFEEHELNEVEKITPTIMIAQNLVGVGHISKRISIFDFGGQKTFRDTYLQNPDYFSETKILLFVVDVLSSDDFAEERDYFRAILNILKYLNRKNKKFEMPQMYVFIHKCDPDKRDKLAGKITKCIIEMTNIFGKNASFFLTSIYDASACRALNKILFLSLPEETLSEIFTIEFFEDIRRVITEKLKEVPSMEIAVVSKIFGDLMGKKLHDLWLDSSLKRTEKIKLEGKGAENLKIIYTEDGKRKFKLKCPYSTGKQKCSEDYCTIARTFLSGLLSTLNLTERSLKIKAIKEMGNCYFIF
ncbi:MAG: ADP-ribosylation factor-like protein [Candidatus Helarchaeota archaeon]